MQIRYSLLQELKKKYPDRESSSILRLILDHAGYPSSAYLGDPDQVPGPDTVAQINEIVSEIHTGKPIQYILGYTYFCDLKIAVNESVLIPRPETEEMVYKIIDRNSQAPKCILDIGTGSGCIALALKNRYPKSVIYGLDLSHAALKVASENGISNGMEVNWIQGDILNESSWNLETEFDLIVSNPPYVLNSERDSMNANVLDFEPYGALFVSDSNSQVFYEAIASFCSKHLSDGGQVWVEINEQLGNDTTLTFKGAGFQHLTIQKDIYEKERFLSIVK